MIKKLSYRSPKKGISEQYNISINQSIIKDMGITSNDRTVNMEYNKETNTIIIKKE
ncbi:hypothetical protein [Fusobacterium perfoetens]|uniref:hypothetical protein n=1 Tax=Fusobacterium perfoetens TaxID=852 RepID=UPI000B1029BD|nr:hypothetical protein [Fusobacterium perfoetens]MCI6152235.1 hypothetical protein [Fusobacterium perfoetens]MDY3237493.1 hypothetical protein [Fusobacterium perfoetens]